MAQKHWQDWIAGLVGAWLVISPWALPANAAASGVHALGTWNLVFGGILTIVVAVSELLAFRRRKELGIAAIGTWLAVSPWIVGYGDESAFMWNALIAGVALVALAGWSIGDTHQLLPKLRRTEGDLRGDMQGVALPDEHEHLAGLREHRVGAGPDILHPGFDVHSSGQATKSG